MQCGARAVHDWALNHDRGDVTAFAGQAQRVHGAKAGAPQAHPPGVDMRVGLEKIVGSLRVGMLAPH